MDLLKQIEMDFQFWTRVVSLMISPSIISFEVRSEILSFQLLQEESLILFWDYYSLQYSFL